MARLMEASEREVGLGFRQRTEEDNLPKTGLVRLRRNSDSDDSDSDSEPGGHRGVFGGSDDSGEIDEALLEGLNIDGGGAGKGRVEATAEERAVLDHQFESVSCLSCVRACTAFGGDTNSDVLRVMCRESLSVSLLSPCCWE